MLEGERPFERVVSRPPQATALGLAVGINRAEAEAYGVPLLRRSVAEEAAARAALLSALAPYTPAVEDHSTATDCILVIDLTGTERLLGPLAEAEARIAGRCRRLDFPRGWLRAATCTRRLPSAYPISADDACAARRGSGGSECAAPCCSCA